MTSEHLKLIRENNARLLRAAPNAILAYIAFLTMPYVYLDNYAYESDAAYWTLGIISWGVTYLLFLKLMNAGGYLDEGQFGGIGSYFVLGIAVGSLVVLGLVGFVFPGLYLLMRWLPAYSRLIASNDGVSSSMWWSWHRTQGFQWALAQSMIGPMLCYAASIVALLHYQFIYYPAGEGSDVYEFFFSVWVNFWITLATAWLTILGISAYGLVGGEKSECADA